MKSTGRDECCGHRGLQNNAVFCTFMSFTISGSMKNVRWFDLSLNVLLPLVAGVTLYVIPALANNGSIAKNHLADGLWAYAFMSATLIVWGRVFSLQWIVAVFAAAALFEWLQYLHLFPGTGDWYDVITYFLFFTAALVFNNFFRTIQKSNQ